MKQRGADIFSSVFQIADILTDVLGRRIVHVDLPAAGLEERHKSQGLSDNYAKMLSAMDTSIKLGAENRTNDVIRAVTGTAPKTFRQYAEAVKDVWR